MWRENVRQIATIFKPIKSNLKVTEFLKKMLYADLQDIESMSSAPAEFTKPSECQYSDGFSFRGRIFDKDTSRLQDNREYDDAESDIKRDVQFFRLVEE